MVPAIVTKAGGCLLGRHDKRGTRAAIKRYAPRAVGQDSRNGGGVVGRKMRFEVLDRLAKIGAGLSAPQKSD